MSLDTPLTKARRGALAILTEGPALPGNETIITTNGRYILRDTANWLIEQGFANRTGRYIEITVLGIQRWRAENSGQFA